MTGKPRWFKGSCMAANDAWLLQGMNGAVPVASGETFTGLTRGVFLFGNGTFTLTALSPSQTTDTLTITTIVDVYVPGSFSVIAATGTAIAYPDSTAYTVA